eukprot:CAMPEP_0170498680 /NCGR_PEP_ID=MMETSP0208-20121228/28587_1 /TAXON_ID=197538 /ORGANISM="Strombidium inclinatum, Strain S3" /LENGTH=128 /DNA_ID=CAMNT_0010775931 /DNA_START=1008 /DNA_END=1393 /DNA_ORIENTATION=-
MTAASIAAPAGGANNIGVTVDLLSLNSTGNKQDNAGTSEDSMASPLPKLPSKPNPHSSGQAHGPKVGDSKETDLLGMGGMESNEDSSQRQPGAKGPEAPASKIKTKFLMNGPPRAEEEKKAEVKKEDE